MVGLFFVRHWWVCAFFLQFLCVCLFLIDQSLHLLQFYSVFLFLHESVFVFPGICLFYLGFLIVWHTINCFYFCKSVNNVPTLTPEFINLTPFSHCNIVLSILLTFSENQFLALWFLCFSVLYLIYLCSNLFYFLFPSSCVFCLLLCFQSTKAEKIRLRFLCVCHHLQL